MTVDKLVTDHRQEVPDAPLDMSSARPFWIFPHNKNAFRWGNTHAVLLPCLMTQHAVIVNDVILAIRTDTGVMYEVGKVGFIRYWRDDGAQSTYLAAVEYIRLHKQPSKAKKWTAIKAGYATMTQYLQAYAHQFGDEAIDAYAWEIVFTRCIPHKGAKR